MREDEIDPKAYEKKCGYGAAPGEPCSHTPIRCQHSFVFKPLGYVGDWLKIEPVFSEVGWRRKCIWCNLTHESILVWS